MTVYIVHASGSHGHFLKLLLNAMIGIRPKERNDMVYDAVEYECQTVFEVGKPQDGCTVINIRVDPQSYLKYFVICLNRTSGHNITAQSLQINTFELIKKHSVLSHFSDSLTKISGQTQGDVSIKFLREWVRLCFFANSGETITASCRADVWESADFVVDFESFYDGTIIDKCKTICESLGLPVNNTRLQSYLSEFKNKNLYFEIDADIPSILKAIDQNQYHDLSATNYFQQAWIDNYLVEQYNVDPLCRNEYFNDTVELINEYKLHKGES